MIDQSQLYYYYKDRSYNMEPEDELFDWLEDVYASANNALPTIDLTEYQVTLQNNQIVEIQHNGNTQQHGTPSSASDADD